MRGGHDTNYRMGFCRDCGRRTRINHVQLHRRAPPRCAACGGMLDFSLPGSEEAMTIRDARKEQQKRLMEKQGFRTR